MSEPPRDAYARAKQRLGYAQRELARFKAGLDDCTDPETLRTLSRPPGMAGPKASMLRSVNKKGAPTEADALFA
jgi:hypothetical protein